MENRKLIFAIDYIVGELLFGIFCDITKLLKDMGKEEEANAILEKLEAIPATKDIIDIIGDLESTEEEEEERKWRGRLRSMDKEKLDEIRGLRNILKKGGINENQD